MKSNEFKNMVKSLILEIKKEKETTSSKNDNTDYLEPEKEKYVKDINRDSNDCITKLVSSIKRSVSKIDKNIKVIHPSDKSVEDRGDIIVRLPGVFYIRIMPKWVGIFDIEAYRDMTDRIYVVGVTPDQILDFIKVNFSLKNKSYVQSAYNKSIDNLEDKTKKRKSEIPESEPVKEKKVSDKEIEDDVSNKSDEPTSEMSTVNEKSIEKQIDHEVERPENMKKAQKMSKKEVDNDLTKNWKK